MSLTTNYLGLTLNNPLIASASPPLTGKLDNIRRLEDAGAGAIVLPSVFQEQIEAEADEVCSRVADMPKVRGKRVDVPSAIGSPYGVGPDSYLDLVRRAREAVCVPVIASLNGSSRAGWTDFARLIQQAGASALELNMYHVPADLSNPAKTSRRDTSRSSRR